MNQYTKYAGLDVHKDTIAVSVADFAHPEVRFIGTISNNEKSIRKMVERLSEEGEQVSFCYEVGPFGYELYRRLRSMGHGCIAVAPTLIPRKPGNRIKTDRRDSESLARLHRAGELSSVWVPGPEYEAIRDLVRTRRDFKKTERQCRQRLLGFLLKHHRVYRNGSN